MIYYHPSNQTTRRSRVVGRARAIGNRVGLNGSQEFESLLLRQQKTVICLPNHCFLLVNDVFRKRNVMCADARDVSFGRDVPAGVSGFAEHITSLCGSDAKHHFCRRQIHHLPQSGKHHFSFAPRAIFLFPPHFPRFFALQRSNNNVECQGFEPKNIQI